MKPDCAITVQSAGVCARQETCCRIPDAVPPSLPMPPPSLAAPLLKYLVAHLVRDARDGGALVDPALAGYLRALHEVAVADDGKDHDESDSLGDVAALVTVSQLAERSGYSCRTLRHWAASGRLAARRVGRTWLIDPDSIRRTDDHPPPDVP
jgi:excisionase family DNA binding protein